MDVYLLPRANGDYFLYSAEVLDSFAVEVAEGDSRAQKLLSYARNVYRWLTRARRRRERLLRSLGELDRVRMFYPSSLSEAEARAVYGGLIRAAIEKHGKWLLVNAAAVPISVPLSLVPGPNLILGYLAWRSVVHYRSKKAGKRAAGLLIDFVPESVLAELEDVVRNQTLFRRKDRIRRLGEKLGLTGLDEAY